MKKINLMLIFGMMLIIVSSFASAASFGVSPSIFEFENLARGHAYEQYIKILSLEEVDSEATLETVGDIPSWVTFLHVDTKEPITGPIMVPSKSSVQVIALFDIPPDAPNGEYEGYIQVRPVVSEVVSGSPVNLVVRAKYNVVVIGDEQISGVVESATVKDTESGQTLRIKYSFENTGNVAVRPTADVVILEKGKEIDSFSFEGHEVNSGLSSTQIVEWDTENRGTGDFEAKLEVFLDGQSLFVKTLPFALLPGGTFTAEVSIGDISKPDSVSVLDVAKTEVKLYNTGKIDIVAKIIGEVKKDGKLVDIIESDEKIINVGDSSLLSFYFEPTEPGEYVVDSKSVFFIFFTCDLFQKNII